MTRTIIAHVAGIAGYLVLGFLAAFPYLLMHKHILGRTGGWELAAVFAFFPMVAVVGAVLLALPLILLHHLRGWPLLSWRNLAIVMAGALAIAIIWGGGPRAFGMGNAPPLVGWFMLAVMAITTWAHLWLARWADRPRPVRALRGTRHDRACQPGAGCIAEGAAQCLCCGQD